MEQKKTNPNNGLRALIDELYAKIGAIGSASAGSNTTNVPYTYGTPNAEITGITDPFTPTKTGQLLLNVTYTGTDSMTNDVIATALYRNPQFRDGGPGGTLITSGPTMTSADVTGTYTASFAIGVTEPVGVPVTYGLNQNAATGLLTGAPFFISITEMGK